jgi:hypothetical protein
MTLYIKSNAKKKVKLVECPCVILQFFVGLCIIPALQRQNAENLKQIFLSPNFHIHVSVSELYIPTMGLPVLLEEICRLILGIYKLLKDT